jgi:hypothetical protein
VCQPGSANGGWRVFFDGSVRLITMGWLPHDDLFGWSVSVSRVERRRGKPSARLAAPPALCPTLGNGSPPGGRSRAGGRARGRPCTRLRTTPRGRPHPSDSTSLRPEDSLPYFPRNCRLLYLRAEKHYRRRRKGGHGESSSSEVPPIDDHDILRMPDTKLWNGFRLISSLPQENKEVSHGCNNRCHSVCGSS